MPCRYGHSWKRERLVCPSEVPIAACAEQFRSGHKVRGTTVETRRKFSTMTSICALFRKIRSAAASAADKNCPCSTEQHSLTACSREHGKGCVLPLPAPAPRCHFPSFGTNVRPESHPSKSLFLFLENIPVQRIIQLLHDNRLVDAIVHACVQTANTII